ncbi:MAG: serine/threonine-protein kinase [Planctomycetota bacterium]
MKGKKKPKDRKQHLGGRSRTVTFINRTLTAAAAADAEADAGKGAGVPGESERYSDVRLIGEGGMGRVYLAHDNALGRQVALKMLREEISNPSDSSRFIEEARITSGLEHPNIIPPSGIGVDEEQRIYYTLKYVPQRDLRSLIEETAREEGDQPLRRSSLFRFLQILRGVCQAVQFAHDQGILHRDLKPENIMVGSYGEALVVDWGLAVRYRKPDSRDGEGNAGAARPARAIIGTPRYMSPEQAEGNVAGLDPRSDLYSLGAILQECLTLGPMVEGDRVDEVLERVRRGGLPSPREQAPHRDIPEALDEICRRATARSRDDRIAGAGDLLEEIDLFLEGTRERERNEREASKRVEEARRESNGWRELAREVETLEEDLRSRSEGIDEWESEEHKLPLWRAQDRLKELRFESAQAFGRAVTRLDEALGYLPDHAEARAALAELYYDRFTEAERSLREEEAIFFGSKAHQYDDGRLAERLEGTGRISLTTEPAAEEILLCTLRDELLRRVPGEPVALGAAPLVEHPLPMGSHLIILRRKGYRDIRLPILMSRCERLAVRVPFYTDEEIGRGYVHVPGGRFIVGGDALAHEAHDLMTVELPACGGAPAPGDAPEDQVFV